MKKSILFFPRLLSLIVFSFLLMQCKKDETPPKPVSELILGSWVMTADTYSPAYDYLGNGSKITDAFPLYDACAKDNILIFKTNSEGEFNEGGAKCDAADPQSIPFLWTLKNSDKTLNISALSDYTIVQLNNTTLKISETFTENTVTYTETYVFTRK